jgi:glycosyltransferase involved in cell wall biosynthesis
MSTDPSRTISSAALLVCTYRRPETFGKLMATVKALVLPEGLAFSVVVADNNPEPAFESYVEPAVRDLAWPVHYGHEPVAGYSSARNKAIEIALAETTAEVFLFVDDDMLLDPDWAAAHLRSLAALEADVVNGRIFGIRERFAHGARLEKCGAGNVSFRRRLVDPAGLGLKFDPTFNKLGMEDQAFFRAATANGAIIRQSDWPLIYNYYGRDEVPEEEVINKMHTTGAMHQNEVALARQRKGLLPAALMASKGVLFGLKGVAARTESRFWSVLGKSDKARRAELSAQKEMLKMRGRFAGLDGRIVSRQDVRRSDPASK